MLPTLYVTYALRATLGEHAEEYLYFAASIFWRAAARSWGTQMRQISLGRTIRSSFDCIYW